jgi:integrase
MPYRLIDPAPGRSPFYRVRGTEFGVYIDRSAQTGDRREAQKFLAARREDARRASVSGPLRATPTFASAALAYMQAGKERRFLPPLLEHFGETPLGDIDQAAIDAAAVALYPDASPATRNRQAYSPVSAVLRHAGVAMVLRRPRGAQGTPRTAFLNKAEAFALLAAGAAQSPRFGALLTILLYTGVRLSEALRLEWSDVDLARATALLRETKNGRPLTVHLPPVALSALANLPDRTGRIFRLTKAGRLYTLWAEAEAAAGLTLPPRSAFHILRHSHATWRRLYTAADTTALTQTGLWRSRNAAAVYEHVDATAESRKSDLLPTPKKATRARKC